MAELFPAWIRQTGLRSVFLDQEECVHLARGVCSSTRRIVFLYQEECVRLPVRVCSSTRRSVFLNQEGLAAISRNPAKKLPVSYHKNVAREF